MAAPGVLALKNGSFLMGYRCAGPDFGSATVEEIEHLTAMVNNAMRRLGNGWMAHFESMTGAFFYWLLFDRSILKGIVDSFSQLARSGLSFTDLLFFMETAMQNIMTAVQGRGGLTLEGIALFFSGLAASLVLSYALTTAVGYMAIVLLENYIVGSLGLILLGFGG
jgi:hypothetical protein